MVYLSYSLTITPDEIALGPTKKKITTSIHVILYEDH